MHQSIRAVNIPSRATPGDSHILFVLPPGFFPKKFWFSSGQIFFEIDKNLNRISILVNVFKRLLKTGGKRLLSFTIIAFCLLQNLFLTLIKSNNIVFETNVIKPFLIKMSSDISVIRTCFCSSLGSCFASGVGRLDLFTHHFLPGGVDFTLPKNSLGVGQAGVLTAGIDA